MIESKKINLDNLHEEDLKKTLLEYLQIDNTDNKPNLNHFVNQWVRIIYYDTIIIGKIHNIDNASIMRYSGYRITKNSLSKITYDRLCTTAKNITLLTEEQFKEFQVQLEDKLAEVNLFYQELQEFCKTANKPFPEIKGMVYPNKNEFLTMFITDDLLRTCGNLSLLEIRKRRLKIYYELLEKYQKRLDQSKKLVGKYFCTPYSIGLIYEIVKGTCHLNSMGFFLRENDWTSTISTTINETTNMYEAPYKLYQKSQEIAYNIQDLHSRLLL